MRYQEMMALDERGPDSLIGRGPKYPWGGLFGGQIVAQSLVAAAHTVEPEFRIHSLHAYFIRRGDADEPIRFDIDRLRNGRRFVTRAVVARQSGGAILHMSASFQTGSAERYLQTHPFPDAPAPDSITDTSWSRMLDRRYVSEADGRALAWLRIPDTPDDPVRAAAALAYLSDDLATDCVRSQQQTADGVTGHHWDGISLDHAIWFHQTPAGNDWQLHDFRCEGVGIPRGLARGQVFASDGTHLATVTQEVLLQPRPPEEHE
ncbi:MAG TPA: acyl-CoA thioesterase domain-containing protein [Acidimicrobiales bacterium]|nr:acyl-CoA thioesterase domain-containing protein [Acidimicrobiales bacterium]